MGVLRNAFRKATLSAVLATSLVAGTGTAFAQNGPGHAGPPPAPDAQTQTVPSGGAPMYNTTVPTKAWENDPNYIRLTQAYEHQVAARDRIFRVQEEGNLRIAAANYQIQQANMAQNRFNYMRSPQGMAQLGAQEAQVNGAYDAQTIQIKAAFQNQEAQMDIQRSQYMASLDNRFAHLPQYFNGGVASPNQGPPAWSTDPAYLQQLQNFDRQQDTQARLNNANETAQLRVMDANYNAQQISVNSSQGIWAARQGLPGISRLGSQDELMTAQYKMQRTSLEANYDLQRAQMEGVRAEFLFSLDQRFGSMPQYRNTVNQGAPRVQTPRAPGH